MQAQRTRIGSKKVSDVGAAEREGTESVGALVQVGDKVERESACSRGEGTGMRAHRPSQPGRKRKEAT